MTVTREDVLAMPEAHLGRVVNLERTIERFGADKVAAFLPTLISSDELGNAALADLMTVPRAERYRMLDQALKEGIDSVPEAPPGLRKLIEHLDDVPEWVDFDQIDRGVTAYWRAGQVVPFVFLSAGLGQSFVYPAVARVTTFTGRFTHEEAWQRTKETERWIISVLSPGGMKRHGKGFYYSVMVRFAHATVRRGLSSHPHWDQQAWGTPIADADMQYGITKGFSASIVEGVERLGYRYSDTEIADMRAMFRYLGHLLGLPEHLNSPTEAEAYQARLLYESLNPGPDDAARQITKKLFEVTTQKGGGYDGMPPLIRKLMKPEQVRAMVHGLCHFFMEPQNAEGLAIPKTKWRHLPKAARPFISAKERLFGHNRAKDERTTRRVLASLERSIEDVHFVASPDQLAENLQSNTDHMGDMVRTGQVAK